MLAHLSDHFLSKNPIFSTRKFLRFAWKQISSSTRKFVRSVFGYPTTSWWLKQTICLNMLVKLEIFSNFRGQKKTYLKPPPRTRNFKWMPQALVFSGGFAPLQHSYIFRLWRDFVWYFPQGFGICVGLHATLKNRGKTIDLQIDHHLIPPKVVGLLRSGSMRLIRQPKGRNFGWNYAQSWIHVMFSVVFWILLPGPQRSTFLSRKPASTSCITLSSRRLPGASFSISSELQNHSKISAMLAKIQENTPSKKLRKKLCPGGKKNGLKTPQIHRKSFPLSYKKWSPKWIGFQTDLGASQFFV